MKRIMLVSMFIFMGELGGTFMSTRKTEEKQERKFHALWWKVPLDDICKQEQHICSNCYSIIILITMMIR